jgi:hypothetical protein
MKSIAVTPRSTINSTVMSKPFSEATASAGVFEVVSGSELIDTSGREG